MAEYGVSPIALEACAQYEQDRHDRNQFPVGAFFDMIDSRHHNGAKASADWLFIVAEVGAELFYDAIGTADNENNAEFFVRAYERWGEVVDVVLGECGLATRNSGTGQARASR